jgi:hypothetical protein
MSIPTLAQTVRSDEKTPNTSDEASVLVGFPRSAPARPTYFAWTEG